VWLDEAMEDDDKHLDASAAVDRGLKANCSKCRPQLTTIVHVPVDWQWQRLQQRHRRIIKTSLILSQC